MNSANNHSVKFRFSLICSACSCTVNHQTQRETRVKQAAVLDLQRIFDSILAMKVSNHISYIEVNHFITGHRKGKRGKNMKDMGKDKK